MNQQKPNPVEFSSIKFSSIQEINSFISTNKLHLIYEGAVHCIDIDCQKLTITIIKRN